MLIGSPAQVEGSADQQVVDGILKEVEARLGTSKFSEQCLRSVAAGIKSSGMSVNNTKKNTWPALELEASLLKHLGLIHANSTIGELSKTLSPPKSLGIFDPFKDRFVLASWLGR